jgi:hypothetical protein
MDSAGDNLLTEGQTDILNTMMLWTSFLNILKQKQIIENVRLKVFTAVWV